MSYLRKENSMRIKTKCMKNTGNKLWTENISECVTAPWLTAVSELWAVFMCIQFWFHCNFSFCFLLHSFYIFIPLLQLICLVVCNPLDASDFNCNFFRAMWRWDPLSSCEGGEQESLWAEKWAEQAMCQVCYWCVTCGVPRKVVNHQRSKSQQNTYLVVV